MEMLMREDAGMDDDERETAIATEMGGPTEPSDATRRHHELTHLPFQPWCERCVRGRAPVPPHRRMGGEFPKRWSSKPTSAS